MGFNKVNGLVTEQLTYTVDLRDWAWPRSTLVVEHRHPLRDWRGPCDQRPRYDETYDQMMERCYWNYMRVCVPSEAELSSATPHAVPGEALLSGEPDPAKVTVQDAQTGHRVLGTFLLLRPGETLATRFEYILPRGTLQFQGNTCTYSLVVQKQPGTAATPLQVRILLPSGAVIKHSDPEPDATQDLGLEYALTLETDQAISISFEAPGR
jgi:hypothetical protein